MRTRVRRGEERWNPPSNRAILETVRGFPPRLTIAGLLALALAGPAAADDRTPPNEPAPSSRRVPEAWLGAYCAPGGGPTSPWTPAAFGAAVLVIGWSSRRSRNS